MTVTVTKKTIIETSGADPTVGDVREVLKYAPTAGDTDVLLARFDGNSDLRVTRVAQAPPDGKVTAAISISVDSPRDVEDVRRWLRAVDRILGPGADDLILHHGSYLRLEVVEAL